MQMLYNSDSFVVVRFDAPDAVAEMPSVKRRGGGYEIVDKLARKEIFIEGTVALAFRQGVEKIVEGGAASEESIDDFIAGFAALAQQPLALH
jgi:hypothetical protein